MHTLIKIYLNIIILFMLTIPSAAQDSIKISDSRNFENNKYKLNSVYDSSFSKIYFSAGAGIGFPSPLMTLVAGENEWGEINPILNFQVNIMKRVQPGLAIRGDIRYSYLKEKNQFNSIGGDWNSYSLNFDILLGRQSQGSIVNGYAILGSGMNIIKISDKKYFFPEYNYNTMQFTGNVLNYTFSYEADNFLNLDCGGGLTYKLSDNTFLYTEGVYSFPFAKLGKYGGAGWEGILFGTVSLTAGVRIGL